VSASTSKVEGGGGGGEQPNMLIKLEKNYLRFFNEKKFCL